MKRIITFSMVIMILLSSMFVVNAKTKIQLDESIVKEIKDNLTSLSVDEETQDKLISKLERGELWDCMNQKKINAISQELLAPTIDDPIKRVTFKDGSVLENSIDITQSTDTQNDDIVTPLALRTYYNNVKVSGKNGLSAGGFYADYYIDWNYNDGITAVRDSYINVVGGSYSNKVLTLVRSAEYIPTKKAAEATLTADITYAGGIAAGETFHMKMYVGNNKMISGMLGKVGSVY